MTTQPAATGAVPGSARFVVEEITREGELLQLLRDTATGARAEVWPACGANCLSAQLPAPSGALVEVLLAPDAPGSLSRDGAPLAGAGPGVLDTVRREPTHWGIPLLFPYPSRLPRHEWLWDGQVRTFSRESHGFVLDRPWRVARTRTGNDRAEVTCVFESADHPDLRASYPFDYRVEVIHGLSQTGLALHALVVNTGREPMPFAWGSHPYFRLPLGPRGERATCRIVVPAARKWDGAALRSVSDGAAPDFDALCPPVAEGDLMWDLRRPTEIGERQYDGVLTDFPLVDGQVECIAEDPHNDLALTMRATPEHASVTVFTPTWGSAVCFEPWTSPPNALNMAARGLPNSGVVVLEPGATWQASMWVMLAPLED